MRCPQAIATLFYKQVLEVEKKRTNELGYVLLNVKQSLNIAINYYYLYYYVVVWIGLAPHHYRTYLFFWSSVSV